MKYYSILFDELIISLSSMDLKWTTDLLKRNISHFENELLLFIFLYLV